MPLRVAEEDKNLQGAMETALVEGLQQKYEVFAGEQVAQKAKEIFSKESHSSRKDCDETRCMQNIAEAFQAELIATANVSKQKDGYFLALSIQNIFDNRVVYSKSLPCKFCDAYQVVEKLKGLVAPQAEIRQPEVLRRNFDSKPTAQEKESIVAFRPESGSLQGVWGACEFAGLNLPQDFAVYAAGAYKGAESEGQIDQSGHQVTRFDVVVNSPERPSVLILGAYEPSIWNIGWTRGTKILAVLASGYHRQSVAGLPKETPILISTYDNKGPCGYTDIKDNSPAAVSQLSMRVFDRPVDMVHVAANGKVVVGVPLRSGDPIWTSRDVPPESIVDNNKPLAGPAGLNDAVAKGVLRPVKQEDVDAWERAGGRRPPMAMINAYVILKPFRLPAGLYGGNSATFYLLKGVAYPTGALGHSTLYDFNTMTCGGVTCAIPMSVPMPMRPASVDLPKSNR